MLYGHTALHNTLLFSTSPFFLSLNFIFIKKKNLSKSKGQGEEKDVERGKKKKVNLSC